MKHGPCAKTRVTCEIWDHDRRTLLLTGENSCSNAQDVCPRAPGEGYAKCRTVCMQLGHAEIVALQLATLAKISLSGCHAVIRGHTYACRECQEALYGAGIASISVLPADKKKECHIEECALGMGCKEVGKCYAKVMLCPEECGGLR